MKTPQDIADHFKVTTRTVTTWIRSGVIKAVRFGRQWRITDDEFERIIKEGVKP